MWKYASWHCIVNLANSSMILTRSASVWPLKCCSPELTVNTNQFNAQQSPANCIGNGGSWEKHENLIEGDSTSSNVINSTGPSHEQSRKVTRSYYRCGYTDHIASACQFWDSTCNKCHKKGHLVKVCQSGPKDSDQQPTDNLYCVSPQLLVNAICEEVLDRPLRFVSQNLVLNSPYWE